MDILHNLALGAEVAFSWQGLLFCFVGVLVGTFVGVLPGIGPLAAISLALPMTYYLSPPIALIMLAGIFYGAQYGGSIAAILLNLPGTASAAVTCIDGNQMTKQGRAGVALFTAAISSFCGGIVAIFMVLGFTPMIASFATDFGAVDYFSIMLLGLVAASTLSVGSPLKGMTMVMLGIALGLVGTDDTSGTERFTFGVLALSDGISLVALAMGLFGVGEILANLGQEKRSPLKASGLTFKSMLPKRHEWNGLWKTILRGSGIGAFVGALPGSGPAIAAFMAYAAEKKLAKNPENFGKGEVRGVASPESANNAAVQAAFIPTLSLGIPGDAVMAVLLGAMILHGISPGPELVTSNPEMFWGLVVSFGVGNIMLLVLNLPLIRVWVRMLSIPYHVLYPAMLFFICIGVFSVRSSVFDIYTALFFGVVGYFLIRLKFPAAPLLLGFILGPMMEVHFRRGLLLARGDYMAFVDSVPSTIFLILTALFLVLPLWAAFRKRTARAANLGD
ncbi:tripartite tricarboxylate transporter permease [Alloalcanivorax gelatiniphagus]|uniref:Tripartite tricarboxylate transporter permease n=1 Tax=Alloalcanivorax gelatiniphagus TaxID=1194167 RepID=A0ABY2XPW5_9GAMM|nr:tripartite tricarboxylate transporter permease [Alloalcanivorax gelatiniphagus]TMW14678.1 tripartite tricarboxylate transporter permease [Alloalcanivorax gelatiniphagus]